MIFLTRCVLHGAGFTRLFVGSLTLVVARWCAAFVLSGTATLSIVAQETPCPPTVVWQTSFGGDSLETGVQIAPTSDGGCVIVGYSDSGQSGNKSSPTFGKNDIWVVRIDGNGDKLWERALGGSGQDYFNAVCATSDGGYLIGGGSDSPADGNKDSPNLGNSDFWLIRLDPQGDKIWERTYGGRGSEALGTITAAPDGGFLLAGESFTSGVEANFGFGRYDIWIVRIDANGEELWDRYLGGSQDEWLGTIPIGSADGGYFLVINSDSPISGNKTAPNFGAPDIWLVKLDATGRILWDKTYGGTDADYGSAVVERSDGSIVLGGSSFSAPSGNKTSPLFGLDDIWLVELDSHGEKVWERTYGGAGEDGLSDMVLMPDSGLLLYGSSDSMDGDRSSPGFGLGDWWLVRVGPTGKKQWDLSIGGDSSWEGPHGRLQAGARRAPSSAG